MKNKQLLCAAIGFLASASLLVACGSHHSGRSADTYMMAETTAAAAYDDYDFAEAEMMPMEAYAGAAMANGMASYGQSEKGSAVSEDDLSGTTGTDAPVARKLIRNVNLTLQTTEYEAAVNDLRIRIAELDGYIEQSDAYDNGYYGRSGRSLSMTARIPNARLDEFLDTALTHAKVTNRSESTEDITLKYTDMEARVQTLEVERDRLMELLASADNIDSIIALESRLSDIRYELESIKSSLRVYDNRVDYSTVRISLNEVQVIEEPKEATFGERLSARFKQNLLDLLDSVTDLLIDLISNLPGIILLIIVIIAIVRIFQAIFGRENREARKEERRLRKEKKHQRKMEKLNRKMGRQAEPAVHAEAAASAVRPDTTNAAQQTEAAEPGASSGEQ